MNTIYWNTMGIYNYTENPILIRTVRRYGKNKLGTAHTNLDIINIKIHIYWSHIDFYEINK